MNNPKSFPDCYKDCAIAHHLGVGECESICPEKFDDLEKKATDSTNMNMLEAGLIQPEDL